jgi:hypothetical protein
LGGRCDAGLVQGAGQGWDRRWKWVKDFVVAVDEAVDETGGNTSGDAPVVREH